MTAWLTWTTWGLLAWTVVAGFLLMTLGKLGRLRFSGVPASGEPVVAAPVGDGGIASEPPAASPSGAEAAEEREREDSHRFVGGPLHILVVDDDPNLRELLRTSFEFAEIEVEEAADARSASAKLESRHPDVIVLDVSMPGMDGLTFCRGLKADPFTRAIPVVLLTGDATAEKTGREAGADAFLRKPFSPLELLTLAERLAVPNEEAPKASPEAPPDRQLLLYAQDFRRLLELERGQRALLQNAYRETVVALARALESKDGGTGAHSERVRQYATLLTEAIDPVLLDEPGLEYGFILHDIGKIGIPDSVLAKPGPLSDSERRLIETHTVLGEQMVGEAALLRGQGARVVRSHHERWDGRGYPDRLSGDDIPLGARIFSLADALDAMTSHRPYRPAGPWPDAVAEIAACAGTQFDPDVVDVFLAREEALRRVYSEFNLN